MVPLVAIDRIFENLMLYALVYGSTPANGPPSKQELDAILVQARINNALSDVTGMLVYHNHEYVQLIEGEQSTIKRLYRSIATDARHSTPSIYWEGPVSQRTFTGWRMKFVRLEDIPLAGGMLKGPASDGLSALLRHCSPSSDPGFFTAVQQVTPETGEADIVGCRR